MRIVLFCIFALCALPNGFYCEDELLMSHVIFRHGSRNPRSYAPKSMKKDWEGGLGTLRPEGANEAYNLGETLKDTYISQQKFVSAEYDFAQIYVRSSSSDRCLMAAEAFLAGMFPPSLARRIKDNIRWQPLPVHTVDSFNDSFRVTNMDCPKRDELRNEIFKSQAVLEHMQENEAFLKKVSENTGYDATDLSKIWDVYDEISVGILNGIAKPEWVTNDDLIQLKKTTEFIISQTYSSDRDEIKKLYIGPLLYRMIRHMLRFLPVNARKDYPEFSLEKDNGDKNNAERKLFIYSTHEIPMYALLSTLGASIDDLLPFAASLTIELQESKKHNDKSLVVKVFYSADTKTFKQLSLPKCNEGKECTLQEFIKAYKKFAEPDLTATCTGKAGQGYGTSWTKRQYVAYIVSVLYSFFSTVFFVGVIFYLVFGIRRF